MLDDYPNERRIQKHGVHYRGMVLHGVHHDVVRHDVVHHDVVHLPLNVTLQSLCGMWDLYVGMVHALQILSDLHGEMVRAQGVPLDLPL